MSRRQQTLSLSVLVPAFNESATIQTVLRALLKQKDVAEIIVVDDCSRDDTSQKARALARKDSRIRILRHKENQGKGRAVRTALYHATGTHVLIQDADLEYNPEEIPLLLDLVKKERAQVVFGSRFFGAHTNMFYWHYLGNKMLNFVINVLYNTTLSDMETCYKVLPTKLMRQLHLRENDFRIEPEITCKLLRRRVRIVEVPITYVGRTYEEGKKITWFDGVLALHTIFRITLGW